ncbi:cytochrome D oxidase subunit I [Geothrix rubra]|uniref:Cytochrome D oxidase subunit I n=1 Tax=Geothrix rubra TaxID=2927977 RepID=A0ABQ5Q6C8_9BACT|nr:cytochrome d ubiquinol oxidase subunit II [Geothrix rubra]GLH70327.1 cytochrome D oxidase subunit I [Geothrix rubra]
MEMLWFWLVSVMVAIYVVLDGFDFGAGILHLFVAKTNEERREVLGAIGPLWDGNEVWLLAGGGSMFLAFPKVLASGFSGFYLAMWLVVWCLMLRGISIEFRSHLRDGLWRHFWDTTFAVSSILLPVLFGAALGNVLRGVPVDGSGYFEMALWTNFRVGTHPGILDWYTVLIGVFALATLAGHGALFLAWKTEGAVHDRARGLVMKLWGLVLVLWIVSSYATSLVNPGIFQNLSRAPLGWLATLIFLAGLALVFVGTKQARPLLAFLGSSAFILGILAASAACVYPVMLRSTLDPAYSLTALNASVGGPGLRAGLVWWLIGFPIALGYFAFLFRFHRGKVKAAAEGEGY